MTPYQQAVYNLFMRNWMNGIADESHLDAAVEKGLLTPDQVQTIKITERV
ncbi:hypothetical protein [Bacillus infantis]|jgi:hypothetical protein